AGQVFIANEKVDPSTVKGAPAPNPTDVPFHYGTKLNGGAEVSGADGRMRLNGTPQLASSIGSGAGTAVVTDQLLHRVVAQAIDQWRAAGIDPQSLRALEQVPIHVADITEGWLGLMQQGEILIDRTAAGWGWSTGSTPASGRMDLLTVVTHEFGHILGLAPTATGVMEVTLTPGVRALPEAGAPAGTSGAILPP